MWAGICHCADILLDEKEPLLPFIAEAKDKIPASILPSIRPIICGGDTFDPSGFSDDYPDYVADILRHRKRAVELFNEAGFGEPHVRWNDKGETTSLIAYLKNDIVYIENSIDQRRGEWPICHKAAPELSK